VDVPAQVVDQAVEVVPIEPGAPVVEEDHRPRTPGDEDNVNSARPAGRS
jgi:hypothetical protein